MHDDQEVIERKIKLGNLYEFYGELLTDKQKDILDLYCNDDYAIGEISDSHDISRQAVFDTIKRCEKILESYETKLGLYVKFSQRQVIIDESAFKLAEIMSSLEDEKVKSELHAILERLGEISM